MARARLSGLLEVRVGVEGEACLVKELAHIERLRLRSRFALINLGLYRVVCV